MDSAGCQKKEGRNARETHLVWLGEGEKSGRGMRGKEGSGDQPTDELTRLYLYVEIPNGHLLPREGCLGPLQDLCSTGAHYVAEATREHRLPCDTLTLKMPFVQIALNGSNFAALILYVTVTTTTTRETYLLMYWLATAFGYSAGCPPRIFLTFFTCLDCILSRC